MRLPDFLSVFGSGGHRTSEQEWERRVSDHVRALDMRPPFSVEAICEALARSRGRPIEMIPYPLPTPGPIGLWVGTPRADLIIYQRETTSLHQEHIILHEVGHILADHHSAGDGMDWDSLLPALKSEAIHRVLHRCSYDTSQEREAELTATMLLERASVLDRLMPARQEDPSTRRIRAALGGRQEWL
ncbi:hypothetical protein [Streptomyces iconiensis]|uniref:IrrE N-terminal-like domain-containing protein n=1 Tax=Streptomyces iconiensis TaxID=1384038 RepID=A0ABT6ZUQ1_9ACTN|nr:hypothetical protein [Streptomyces iconiensis]MDJ1132785.1 hypothetical protein [Streptomyces iconiensis]